MGWRLCVVILLCTFAQSQDDKSKVEWLSRNAVPIREALYTVGFTAYQGTVGNPRMTPWTLQPPAADSPENPFHAAGKPYAFVDSRGLPADHWLRKPLTARPFGYAQMRSNWTSNFDGMVFTDLMFPNSVAGTVPDGVNTKKPQAFLQAKGWPSLTQLRTTERMRQTVGCTILSRLEAKKGEW
jgi:hypothetical protein